MKTVAQISLVYNIPIYWLNTLHRAKPRGHVHLGRPLVFLAQ